MRTRGYRKPELTSVAAAVLAALAPIAHADEAEVAALIRPESVIEGGVGVVDRDNRRFGQYSGLRKDGGYLLFDADFVRRYEESGTWLRIRARNIGLDSRELRVEHNRQGDWGYFVDFSQTPRYSPYPVSTGLTGIGTSTVTINGTALRNVELKTQRDTLSLGFDKALGRGFDFQVRFRNEEKDGERLFGQGTNNTINWLAEPIHQVTRQVDAVASYTGERLQLSGGYYGTTFDNHNTRLDVVGGIAGQTPISLPPDNQSHFVHLAGGYSFTPATRGTFKLGVGRITQDDPFIAASLPGRTDLGGRIDITQAQLGITSRPLPKLSLTGNLRYEDRRDKTPIARYFVTGIGNASTLDGNNEPRSVKSMTGKIEASYLLPANIRATGGVDYDEKQRNTYRVRSVSHRDKTHETTYRAELRRSVGETLTGAVSYAHANRGGSDFLQTVTNNNAAGSNLIAPIHLADRERDKIGLSMGWTPTEALSLQFLASAAHDRYSTRTSALLGPREGRAELYSIDASYRISENWQASAWYTRDDNRAEQATQTGASNWRANLRNVGDSVGIGMQGKPHSRIELSADLTTSSIVDSFGAASFAGPQPPEFIPDINTKTVTLKLAAKYELQKNSGVRLMYVFDRWSSDEWTWASWVYSDGTRVISTPVQRVHFVGATYYYRF